MRFRFNWIYIIILLVTLANPQYIHARNQPTSQKVQMTVQVDMQTGMEKSIKIIIRNIENKLQEQQIEYSILQNSKSLPLVIKTNTPLFSIQLKNKSQTLDTLKLIQTQFPELDLTTPASGMIQASLSQENFEIISDKIIEKNIAYLKKFADYLSVKKIAIERSGHNTITLQLPNEQKARELRPYINGIPSTNMQDASIQLHLVIHDSELYKEECKPSTSEQYLCLILNKRPIFIKKKPLLTQESIAGASINLKEWAYEPLGVSIYFNQMGKKQFSQLTQKYRGDEIAFVFFEKNRAEIIYSATIREPIKGGSTFISGSKNRTELIHLVKRLNSAILAAPMKVYQITPYE